MGFEELLKDLNQLLFDFKVSFLAFLPKLILALVVFLIGYLIARFVQYLSKKFIRGTNRFITNKKVSKHFKQKHFEQSSIFISKTLYWIIIVMFLTIASEIMGVPVATAWLSGIVQYLPNILAAIIIVFVGIIGGKIVADIILSATIKSGVSYGNVLSRTVQYSILLFTILIAIDQIGIDIALVTIIVSVILGALLFGAALSFGLGAKTSVSNIIASYYVHNTYREGNTIKINNVEGTIVQITSTAVLIDTTDGQVSVPAKNFSELVSVLVKKG
ncbi:MAG: mechanosensitive ion channel [Ignavibacteria bacterium]|nr:mechanosensitive ion channel [Ignavibacteria bacterium]MBT8381099.1 mechanosensitive ion channel [Ignavibacteria bacterium]MBT8392135.1 mechanosensitive ion channel [Ignavibacteria bacterium]NNJ53535.1 mechanosensitive ion channel [Ignavibacteriaceae bacterium]NNL20462.1 mechanosensitive ion channel [Ignavibacteriaceae bacterium]